MSGRRWKGEGAGSRPLIFAKDEATKIADGKKTQMRRLARREKLTNGFKPSGLRVGSSHDVQRSMKDEKPLARITVTSVQLQRVTEITFQDARAEGYRTRADFAAAWMLKHDPEWPLLEEDVCPACDGWAEIDGERCHNGCDEVGMVMVEATLSEDDILKVYISPPRNSSSAATIGPR